MRAAAVTDPPSSTRCASSARRTRRSRLLYGSHDLLVIDAGASRDIKLGEQFFVRRTDWFGLDGARSRGRFGTVGWVKVVAVNDTTAIAAVEHSCTGVMQGDYLEPFVAPAVPANINRVGHVRRARFQETGARGLRRTAAEMLASAISC